MSRNAGPLLNHTARILSKAAPGQVLADQLTWERVTPEERSTRALVAANLGSFPLKGLEQPVCLYQLSKEVGAPAWRVVWRLPDALLLRMVIVASGNSHTCGPAPRQRSALALRCFPVIRKTESREIEAEDDDEERPDVRTISYRRMSFSKARDKDRDVVEAKQASFSSRMRRRSTWQDNVMLGDGAKTSLPITRQSSARQLLARASFRQPPNRSNSSLKPRDNTP